MLSSSPFDQAAATRIVADNLDSLVRSGRFSEAVDELHKQLLALGMTFEGRKYTYNPAPLLISQIDAEGICRRAEGLAAILDKVAALYATETTVREFFRSYASLEPITLVDVLYRPSAYLNRFDTVWLGGDRFKVLEPNCCCPAGVTSNAITRRAWRSVPAFNDLASGYNIASGFRLRQFVQIPDHP